MSARSVARHAIATALGIVPDGVGSRCVLCGASPFASAGPPAKVFGAGFADWHLCDDPQAPEVCHGCAAILSGRPGRVPPPLRMRSIAVRLDGTLEITTFDRMWQYLAGAERALVLSWAISGKKHHALTAEMTADDWLVVGSDDGVIRAPRSTVDPLVRAVLTLRAGDEPKKPWCSRTEILSGAYRPQTILRDPSRWERAEAIIGPRRGTLLLHCLVGHAPVLPPDAAFTHTQEMPMDDPIDQQCARLLELLARDSAFRATDGKMFWGGVFERRVRRHAGRPLPEFLSRCATELRVPAISQALAEAAALVQDLPAEDGAAIAEHLRTRTTLLVGLAFQRQQDTKAARKAAAARHPST